MSALQMIISKVKETKAFQRNKVPLERKVLATMLCFAGLSYRKASQLVGGLSYVAVHDAFICLRKALPKPERKHRNCIAVDETKTKVAGKQLIVWAARDVDTKEVLIHRCSFTRSSLYAELFLKDVLQYSENKPLFLVDNGPWYPDAFKNLGLEYRHEPIKA